MSGRHRRPSTAGEDFDAQWAESAGRAQEQTQEERIDALKQIASDLRQQRDDRSRAVRERR